MKRDLHQILINLQKAQFTHDVRAHKDLLSLDIYSKIKHMTLHFFKYAGRIQESIDKDNGDLLKISILDTFIICLATANSLNFSLGKNFSISDKKVVASLKDYLDTIPKVDSLNNIAKDLLKDIVIYGGKLAKSIESTDHMEYGNPREDIENSLILIFKSAILSAGKCGMDLEEDMKERFKKIELKQVI